MLVPDMVTCVRTYLNTVSDVAMVPYRSVVVLLYTSTDDRVPVEPFMAK